MVIQIADWNVKMQEACRKFVDRLGSELASDEVGRQLLAQIALKAYTELKDYYEDENVVEIMDEG